nr:hypothetical protein CFP56_65041 [Quercus suber]
MNIGEESTDSWDNEANKVKVKPGQMGASVINSGYESEELLSLDESSSNSNHGDALSDDVNPIVKLATKRIWQAHSVVQFDDKEAKFNLGRTWTSRKGCCGKLERISSKQGYDFEGRIKVVSKIRKRLYKEKMAFSRWLACWAGHSKSEVKNGLESFTVDLAESKSSCRKRDIIDIPCAYAISCIFFNRENANKYVHPCYKRTVYITCYEPIIDPING